MTSNHDHTRAVPADDQAPGPAAARPSTAKPVILAVDDDAPVLAAVLRDLRAEFGERFGIYGAPAGDEALRLLRDLRLRGRCVALILADQRMPGMTGIEFLRQAMQLVPDAKRVLLTAYSDNEVAIRAINEVRLDHYLMKPCDPPEEALYPVLSDLLDDWRAIHVPETAAIRIIDHPWSAEGHRLRDFLARNLVPFRWLDMETEVEAGRLLDTAGVRDAGLPFVVFADGTHLAAEHLRRRPQDRAEDAAARPPRRQRPVAGHERRRRGGRRTMRPDASRSARSGRLGTSFRTAPEGGR
jgi:CheY-like chemotaxis protein